MAIFNGNIRTYEPLKFHTYGLELAKSENQSFIVIKYLIIHVFFKID